MARLYELVKERKGKLGQHYILEGYGDLGFFEEDNSKIEFFGYGDYKENFSLPLARRKSHSYVQDNLHEAIPMAYCFVEENSNSRFSGEQIKEQVRENIEKNIERSEVIFRKSEDAKKIFDKAKKQFSFLKSYDDNPEFISFNVDEVNKKLLDVYRNEADKVNKELIEVYRNVAKQ